MLKKILIVSAFFLTFLLLWQVFEQQVNTRRIGNGETGIEAFIPTPSTIFHTFSQDGGVIAVQLLSTLERAMAGFLLGVLLGILMAILFLFLPIVRTVTFPLAYSINSFPVVGFAPMVILAFGQGSDISIVFISTLICYFPILISMDTALQNTDSDLLDLAHVLNASRWQELVMFRLPLAMPHLFLAMKLALPASIIGATIGEWIGTRNGIGQLITIALYQLKPGLLYASLISVTIVSMVLTSFLYFIQIKFVKS